MLTKITNDIGTSSPIYNTELFDKEKKIFAHKNEMTGECILKLVDDQTKILNFNNNYDQNMELTEDEMIEIIGENLRNFCKDKIIILSNFNNKRFNRSKRSTDKKRYQGQTQTQFVSFGSKNSNQETKNGLAEALSQPDLSRATVSGLNGMGQAQSQSSFGDCNECSGQDYQTHSTHVVKPHPDFFPPLQPLSSVSQNQNSRPFSELNTNRQSPSFQNGENRRGHSINDQFPDTYSGLGTSNKLPGNQIHGYDIRPSPNGQYPGSETTYKVADKQNQGYVINEQYPKSDTTNKLSDNQNYGYGIIPSVDNQYIGSEKNNQLPENQDNRYGIESSLYPGKIQGSKSNNNTELGKIDSGYVYNSANQQIPNLVNTNTPEYKKTVNNDRAYPNSHSINSIPFNPSTWGYPNKIGNNNPNINPQIYLDGPGFPNIPSGSSQGILTPHNSLNYDSTHPNYNRQVPVTTSIEHQNKPSNSQSIHMPNYQHSIPNVLGQLTPNIPILSDPNSQNKQRVISEADGTIQNGFPFSTDIHGGQGYTQLNIPSLCNFLYQTCLNALSNNKKLNEFQIANSQNNVGNSNTEKQIGSTQEPITHQTGFPLYGEGINQYQKQPNSGQPQYTIGSFGSSIQHPINTETGGNINRFQSSYGQPQNTLGSGIQQSGYAPSGRNINQMQPGYGQPQSALGPDGSGLLPPGYFPSSGNVNQMQPNYGKSQDTLESGRSGVQQSGYAPSGGH
ncbi:hornerin-like, partial [Aphis craccivora]